MEGDAVFMTDAFHDRQFLCEKIFLQNTNEKSESIWLMRRIVSCHSKVSYHSFLESVFVDNFHCILLQFGRQDRIPAQICWWMHVITCPDFL
jgi:hypothetical protein